MNINKIHISGGCSGVGWCLLCPILNLASICLERKVVIVIVSVLGLCTECVIFFKRFILILFTNFN